MGVGLAVVAAQPTLCRRGWRPATVAHRPSVAGGVAAAVIAAIVVVGATRIVVAAVVATAVEHRRSQASVDV